MQMTIDSTREPAEETPLSPAPGSPRRSRRGAPGWYLKLPVLLALGCLLAACSPASGWAPLFYTFSPAQAVTHQVLSNSRYVQDFNLLGTGDTPDGKVGVVYTYERSGHYVVGYAVSEKVDPFQWMVVSTDDYESPSPPDASMPLDYQIYQDGYTALFGPVFSKEVTSVQASFSDGENVLTQVAGSYFLIFSEKAVDVCSLQVNGSGSRVLFQTVFSNRFAESNDCPN